MKHASLECPVCDSMCEPRGELKDGGAVYRCNNVDEHGDFRPLQFEIDGDGEVEW